MNIMIRLESPILPEGAIINAEIDHIHDLDTLKRTVSFVFEEAEASRVPVSGIRSLETRLKAIEKAVVDGLPAHTKLEIANNSR